MRQRFGGDARDGALAIVGCAEAIVDASGRGVRETRVVALNRAEVEVARERVQVVRQPRAQFVALVGVEESDRLVLREALVLGVLQDPVAVGGRAAADVLLSGVAAKLRVRVVPAEVEVVRQAVLELRLNRLVLAGQRARVRDEVTRQRSAVDDDRTGIETRRRDIEVAPVAVEVIGADEAVADLDAAADGVLANVRRLDGAQELRLRARDVLLQDTD